MKGQPSLPPPRRKAGNLRKAIILAGCLFLALGVVEAIFAIRRRLAPAPPPATAAPTMLAAGQVTLANYAYLAPGLLYTQASEVLGGPGRELSARDSAGTHRAVYQWAGPGGATTQAVFENDRLVRKSQVGLR